MFMQPSFCLCSNLLFLKTLVISDRALLLTTCSCNDIFFNATNIVTLVNTEHQEPNSGYELQVVLIKQQQQKKILYLNFKLVLLTFISLMSSFRQTPVCLFIEGQDCHSVHMTVRRQLLWLSCFLLPFGPGEPIEVFRFGIECLPMVGFIILLSKVTSM